MDRLFSQVLFDFIFYVYYTVKMSFIPLAFWHERINVDETDIFLLVIGGQNMTYGNKIIIFMECMWSW